MIQSIAAKDSAYLVTALVTVLVASTARAELRFQEPQANAGVVYTGAQLVHRFPFVNQGPGVVEVRDIRASCGCLAPRLPQRTYQPGQEGELELDVNTLSQAAGPHTWSVRLEYQSDGNSYISQVQLSAKVITEVTVQPAALVVVTDRAAGSTLLLTDLRPKPLTITRVEVSSSKLKTQTSPKYRDVQGHWATRIHLEVAADYPDGRHDEVLHIYTDDARYPDLRVPLTIIKRFRQRLAATPSQVTLEAPPGQPFPSRIVLIRDNNNQEVIIDHVMTDDPAIVCRWAKGPNAMATLKVQVDRGQLHGSSLQSAVHVQISKPIRETLTIPVICSEK